MILILEEPFVLLEKISINNKIKNDVQQCLIEYHQDAMSSAHVAHVDQLRAGHSGHAVPSPSALRQVAPHFPSNGAHRARVGTL